MVNAIIKPNLITQARVRIWAEDELVCLTIGNSETIRMGYEDALKFVNHMRLVAGEAKDNAGDTRRIMNVMGNLSALDHNGEKIKQKRRRRE